ncbi:LptE family protein [Hymenobacter psychrotolerans]|uniref:Lipopolysaccharide-assembly n=1 Tax=Hymenobacter psychrotolerans DSM 18569 TaxID=1121959 RepID=A0A1M7F1P3_9BACT|nr:LptE family protein [Hymenobacter psychrotolerans]SHL97923.1 Lipopolysaccharide-assembly [Hymenobacter psychrotolerans DSM 18569]
MNKHNQVSKAAFWVLGLFLLLGVQGCKVYSFTGTTLDPTVKTISIATFQNTSSNGPSFLAQRFTEDFKDYFQRNTSLKLVPRDGDLQFEGAITAYDFAPAAIQNQNGIDQAGVNRLTIQVRVKFINTKDPAQDFEQTFQSNGDFTATQDITQINNDPTATRRITQNIITDAFNKSVANW